MSRNRTKCEERMTLKEVLIEVARRRLLRTNGGNGLLKFSHWRECKDLSFICFSKSARSLGSVTGHREAVCTEAVIGDTVAVGEPDDRAERI